MDISKFINKTGKINSAVLRWIDQETEEKIIQHTSFLQFNPSLGQRLKVLHFGFTEHPKCNCGEYVSYNNNKNEVFKEHCSARCANKSVIRTEKIKATKKQKYGSETYNNRSKAKETCLERYGVESTNVLESVKRKQKETLKSNYGVTFTLQSPVLRTKVKSTKSKKYGSETYNNRSKAKETCLERYGVDSYSKFESKESIVKLQDKQWFETEYKTKTTTEIAETLDVAHSTVNNYRILHSIDLNWQNCFSNISKQETEVFEFIKSLGIEAEQSNKTVIKPKELDIFIPSKKIAIEFDGIMFHSFGKSDSSMFNNCDQEQEKKYFHLEKTRLCEEQGIQLLHIFSNEWDEKQDIWKSVIKAKLGFAEKIYARKCTIKEISAKESKTFLERSHLQGSAPASTHLGLYHDSVLVAVMTLAKPRYTKADYEIIRFANTLNTSVIGGFSKLLMYFIRNKYTVSIVSYANKRWSDGEVYTKNGFEYLHDSEPNYFYFNKSRVLQSRVKFQKHKLDSTKGSTESEIMFNTGFRRIWDCGNKVYKYIKDFKWGSDLTFGDLISKSELDKYITKPNFV